MRKYRIPKALYICLISILVCLSVGYTYAYFSANSSATGKATINVVDVDWGNKNGNSVLTSQFADTNTITLVNQLKRGKATKIQCTDKSGNPRDVYLTMRNENGNVDVYCRIKIEATYINKQGQEVDFSQYLRLVNNVGTAETPTYVDIASGATAYWTYENGYYYYKTASTGKMKTVYVGDMINVAEYIFLDSASSVDMYGADVNIKLTLQAVQSSHDAYTSEWI